jgi:hypothetical protein
MLIRYRKYLTIVYELNIRECYGLRSKEISDISDKLVFFIIRSFGYFKKLAFFA